MLTETELTNTAMELKGLPPRYWMSVPLAKHVFRVPWYALNLCAGPVLSITPSHGIQSFNSSAQILFVLSFQQHVVFTYILIEYKS